MTHCTDLPFDSFGSNKLSIDDDFYSCYGVFPLTEENLAIHTENFPPSKEARYHNTHKYVQDQRPMITMELQLEEARNRELELFEPTLFEPALLVTEEEWVPIYNEPATKQRNKLQWLKKKFTYWIDKKTTKRSTTMSWTTKRRDSSSIFMTNGNRPLSSLLVPLNEEQFKILKYPEMVRRK